MSGSGGEDDEAAPGRPHASGSNGDYARLPTTRQRQASIRRAPVAVPAPAPGNGAVYAHAHAYGTSVASGSGSGSADAFPRPAGLAPPMSTSAGEGPSTSALTLAGPLLDAPFQPARTHLAHVRDPVGGSAGPGGAGSPFASSSTANMAYAPPPHAHAHAHARPRPPPQYETVRVAPARRRHTALESVDTSAPLPPAGPGSPHRDAYATSSQFSPAGPSDGYRRRLSNPHGQRPPLGRKASVEDEPRPPMPPPLTSLAWLSGTGARPADAKHNKSDDEREATETDDSRSSVPTAKKRPRAAWWIGGPAGPSAHPAYCPDPMPSISMTPPSSTAMAFADNPQPLIPLPLDPNNLLPLSSANSPAPSPAHSAAPTPYHSPRGSINDLAAEFAAAGPSAHTHTGSPRTSMSTSSSRFGWATGRTWSESSRSGEDDSSSSPTLGKQWWPRREKVLVVPSPVTTAPRARLTPRLASSRRWTWLFELLGVAQQRKGARLLRSSRQRVREKSAKGRLPPNATWQQRICALVPTRPKTIVLSLLSFALFAVVMFTMIKHILNPDKEALPWRSYCSSSYPTLYSLQDPHAPAPHLVGADFTSPPAHRSSPVNSFTSSSSNPVLTPVGPGHPLWPYSTARHTPFAHDLVGEGLDDVEPVGVLIGVMTTDAGVERRNYIRQSYASHWRSRRPGTEGVRVRFVMGHPRAKHRRAVELENEAFNDILFLDIPENMNSGKTHAFFSWAAANATVPDWSYDADGPVWIGEKKPDYVVKADEDSFIMLGELERRLRAAPRTKAYWGYLVKNLFMAGECYALSFDLVEYIAASPALRTLTRGKEDKLVSRWMRMHPARESIVWVAERCWIYDHPKAGTVYSHGFLFPAEVARVRTEDATGVVDPAVLALRGGPDTALAYSSVSRFGARYRPPAEFMSAVERVEALVEGSALSLLRDERAHGPSPGHAAGSAAARQERVRQLAAARPSRAERFHGDEQERGGTVVVHYIKRQEWWIETMVALLGTADEQGDAPEGGVGTGLGMLERREGRVVGGGEKWSTGVRLEKEIGL
ncbi:hypothetical protein Q5752_002649 [Cryptotrichosporon argae]